MNRPENDSPKPPIRVLLVCSGNTCRSPMAEVLFKRAASRPELPGLEVRSAGTHTRPGLGASGGASRAVRRHGLSLEDHTSRVLSKELVEWADLIFAMGPGHLQRIDALGGARKASLLGVFATEPGPPGTRALKDYLAVPDPYGGDDQVYEETFLTLESYVDLAMKKLAEGDGE